ncbi:polysaccharide biosynthesis/export family protein [Pseudoroseicyclus sp. CXY001]|uniref:polysaccharide biosynthesis/export family protein n=1 Tax=Pseudoroseicyclus sp. CXY001 TaxID=3242492 RepID=UPI003570DA21
MGTVAWRDEPRLGRTLPAAFAACLALVLLAGCTLPRGAGLESEVLGNGSLTGGAASADETGAEATPRDFSVEPVTRALLPRYAAWPALEERLNWITRQPEPANRIIDTGDQLAITIWTAEENSLLTAPGQRAITMQQLTVSAAGEIFLPYIGNVRVAGMSPDHARDRVQEEFAAVSNNAQVQLEMTEGPQSTVALVGGVTNPGSYPIPNQDFSILELLAAGGGVHNAIHNPQVRLMRGGAVYGTSVERLYAEPNLDTTLHRGDRVMVAADERYFLSLGATGSESRHEFPRDELTALEAMSIVGGVSDNRANPKGILILREYPASAVRADGSGPPVTRVVFTIDLTSADGLFSAGRFPIYSGDLIYGTESPLSSAQAILGIFGSLLSVYDRL